MAAISLILPLLACSPDTQTVDPEVLRIGVLPDESADALRSRYSPLIAYLASELNQDVQLVIPETYDELLEIFGSGDIEIAHFGGATFVFAATLHQAVPLVTRDIDTKFSTYVVTRTEETAEQVDKYGGRDFTFGAELSTSGHFMPRFFFQEAGLDPESFFGSVAYSGTHDKTAYAVRDGQADIGAVNSEVFETMLRDGRIEAGLLRIIWESPLYTDYVWAVQPGFSQAYIDRLRNAFLKLSLSDKSDTAILQGIGAGGFLPALRSDFDDLETIMLSTPQSKRVLEAAAH